MNRLGALLLLLLPFGPWLFPPALGADALQQIKRIDQGLDWGYCSPAALSASSQTEIEPGREGVVYMEADSAEFNQSTQVIQLNRAAIRRDETYLEANKVIYHKRSRKTELENEVYIEQPSLRITGNRGQIELGNHTGWFSDIEYRLPESQARGLAARVEMLSKTRSRYQQLYLTTCPPGSRDWSLSAKAMEIDQEKGWGSARHAVLRLGKLPILYSPYFTFPVDDRRKSGILFPSWGTSLDLGTELTVPYYFNLAPNYDATFTPRWMSKRGMMLGAEFRYLGARQSGILDAEVLDDKVDSELHDNQRSAIRLTHKSKPIKGLSTRIDAIEVSDMQYLSDFNSGLQNSSTRNLERIAEADYRTGHWRITGQLQDFQTIDPNLALTDYPYSLMPRLTAGYKQLFDAYHTELGVRGEYTFFNHDTNVTGQRIRLTPSASLPLRRPWGHLIPRLTLNYAGYHLENTDPGEVSNPSYLVPTLSLDTGLVFERDSSWLGTDAIQTLEPRVYYLYAPYEDQSDIPDFDTTYLEPNFANLFRDNRFSGGDRVGDANQVSLALTSRWLEAGTGRERLRANIGQILYFQDRRVQLEGGIQDQPASALFAELSSSLSTNWRTALNLRWDPEREEKQIDKSRLGLHYRRSGQQLFNIIYNYNVESKIEDLDLSFYWRIDHRFSFMGDWKHSLFYGRDLNRVIGFEYGGRCCWRLRALYQQYINQSGLDEDIDSAMDTRFMVKLELQGLGSLGQDVQQTLRESIYGYQPEQ